MKCPVDDVTLVMSERSGVEIDYCPTCRGVWLDRGELDKILDRFAAGAEPAEASPAPPPAPAAPRRPEAVSPPPLMPSPLLNDYGHGSSSSRRQNYPGGRPEVFGDRRGGGDRSDRYDNRFEDYRSQNKYGSRRPKKKKDWLSDLFDF